MNCDNKRSFSMTMFTMILGLVVLTFLSVSTVTAAEQTKSSEQGLSGADLSAWFDGQAPQHYEYQYNFYDPYFLRYYSPLHDNKNANDDWFYDSYTTQASGQKGEQESWLSSATFWGGYDNANKSDDWFYDYYDTKYVDYYEAGN